MKFRVRICLQVRGAYVKLERARAAELGYESPIWDNIQGTHANFDRCLDAVLDEVRQHGEGVVRPWLLWLYCFT